MPQILQEWLGYCHRTESNPRSGKSSDHNKWWAACLRQDEDGAYYIHTLFAGLGKKSSERIERFDSRGNPLTLPEARRIFRELVQEKQSVRKGYIAHSFDLPFGTPTPITVPSFGKRFAASTTSSLMGMAFPVGMSRVSIATAPAAQTPVSVPCTACRTITPLLEGFCSNCGMELGAQSGRNTGMPTQAAIPMAPIPSSGPLPIGHHLNMGRYTVMKKVGEGGMGAVYKAVDHHFAERVVAIKELVPDTRRLTPQQIQEATSAFRQEAMFLAPLSHQSLPRIYDHFIKADRSYLVMDFIEGATLERRLEDLPEHRLPLERVLRLGIDLCDVLDYLHTQQPKIIFRDLKPGNIMITLREHVYLIDFGIARLFKVGQQKDTMALGSPGYAAPEQYGKAQSTPKTDLYGLGATLHHALTGIDPSESPFHFPSFPSGIEQIAGLEDLLLGLVKMIEEERIPESAAKVKIVLQRMLARLR